jgi:hypothetical protein
MQAHMSAQCIQGSEQYNLRYSIYSYTMEAPFLGPEQQLYALLNCDLRSRATSRFDQWRPFVYYLTAALRTLPDVETTVYKGLHSIPSTWVLDGTKSLYFSGFSSTSMNEQVARGFAAGDSGIVLKIKVINAKDVQPYSWFGSEEQELILSPNMGFMVISDGKYNHEGTWYADLQQIPSERIWT